MTIRDLNVFCSDVHLEPSGGATTDRFLMFLESVQQSKRVRSLHVLGDLFHYWLGQGHEQLDDYRSVLLAFSRLAQSGVEINFIWGNRDFLIQGRPFQRSTGIRIRGDEHRFQIAGQAIKLVHGDLLCANDVSYQRFRAIIRSGPLQMLARVASLQMRRQVAKVLRTMSEKEVKRKSYKVMDLDEKVVRQHYVDGTQVLICGHIHKEQHRDYQLGARRGDLYVLGSWDHAAPFLVASLNGQFQFANGGVCDSDYD
jgi:UDP-2,3-diacylglucosamine hydrolase